MLKEIYIKNTAVR